MNVNYTESEAAEKLGVSVDQLRMLVRDHISRGDAEGYVASFRPSDIVVLRILASTSALACAHA